MEPRDFTDCGKIEVAAVVVGGAIFWLRVEAQAASAREQVC